MMIYAAVFIMHPVRVVAGPKRIRSRESAQDLVPPIGAG